MKRFCTIILALSVLSCVRLPQYREYSSLSGCWYPVTADFMTDRFIEFNAGTIRTYVATAQHVATDTTMWNCDTSTFGKPVFIEPYSISGGILFTELENYGRITLSNDSLRIGGNLYLPLRKFSEECYSRIVSSADSLHFGYTGGRLKTRLTVERALPGHPLSDLRCDADWIDVSLDSDSLAVMVSPNNRNVERRDTVTVSYVQAKPLQIIVSQKAWGEN